MDQQNQSNKAHRAGKDPKKGNKSKLHTGGFNAKAFSVAAPGKLERQARRTSDVSEYLSLNTGNGKTNSIDRKMKRNIMFLWWTERLKNLRQLLWQ